MKKKNFCPRCERDFEGHASLSRRDNKTEICPNCGLEEALFDYLISRRENGHEKNSLKWMESLWMRSEKEIEEMMEAYKEMNDKWQEFLKEMRGVIE